MVLYTMSSNDNSDNNDNNDDNVFMENGSEIAIIREIYDGAHEVFEQELERALDMACETIVIEPIRLGEETARWITIGNCLQSTAVVTGFGSILSGIAWPDKPLTQCSLAAISLLSNGVHWLSWQFDPCSNYKVKTDSKLIAVHSVNTDSPTAVVLIRRSNSEITRNNIFQTAISLIAFAFSAFKFYKSFKFAIA